VRILVLSYETPAFPAGGGPARQHLLLGPLAARHTVRVLSTGGKPEFGAPTAGVDLRLLFPDPRPPAGSWVGRNARHYAGGRPWQHLVAAGHVAALARALPEEMAALRPDVVLIEHGELGALVHHIPHGHAKVLVLHNILLAVQWQRIAAAPSRWDRIKEALEIPLMGVHERRDARAATEVIAVTDADAALLGRLAGPGLRVGVVPNCVDAGYWRRTAGAIDSAVLVMTASFHYPPNQLAALELATDVLPRVRREVPGAGLRLVGQGMPPALVERLARQPGVEVVGAVDDVRPHLWSAAVATATLRFGSGSPLKALEALAAGIPVVASPRVARALGIGEQAGLLVARDAAETAAAAVRLLRDGDKRSRLGEAGVAAVRRDFSHLVASRRLEEVLLAAAERARREER
jgi:glycosyltransferase involved in cell wall biosynthesis